MIDEPIRTRSPNGTWNVPPDYSITAAARTDEVAIAALLRAAGLPYEDFAAHLSCFRVARDAEGEVVGAIGAELAGEDALLRSLVVAPAHQRGGLGHRLVDDLERSAAARGVVRWWLLTTTAEKFFIARGFRIVPRAQAPAAIAATAEFSGLCPSVAVCLMRERKADS